MLEDRTLLSGNTLAQAALDPLPFINESATASGSLAASNDVELYQIVPNANDIVTVSVAAQSIGSGLNSYLRLFKASSPTGPYQQIATNDNFEGTDSRLTFQADGSTYYIGVSASGNENYDPTVAPDLTTGSIAIGATHGLFQLTVTDQSSGSAVSSLSVASLAVQQAVALSGDNLTINYQIENSGAATSGAFTVQFLLATDNGFTSPTVLPPSVAINSAGLAPGDVLTGPATVTLPGGLASGTYYIGVDIEPSVAGSLDNNVNLNANQVQGSGWASFAVLSSYTNGPASSLAAVTGSSAPPSLIGGLTPITTVNSGSHDFYTVTVGADGLLNADVQNISGSTQLTLMQTDGTPLIQSTGSIQQQVLPGTYILEVSPRGSSAQYRLSARFTAAFDPLANIPLGISPNTMVTGDFNGDGITDLAIGGNSIIVLPGLGNGSYGSPVTTSGTLFDPFVALYAADFNNDGITDLVAVDLNGNVTVETGRGNGMFNPTATFAFPFQSPVVAVGDFNNDGNTDLAIGITGSPGSLYVYLGDGHGNFTLATGSPQTINDNFQGPLAVGDFNNDHFLDIAAASGTLLTNNGDGTFTPGDWKDSSGDPAAAVVVVDLNHDGNADIVAVPSTFVILGGNTVNGKITVSYGHGDGTFQGATSISVLGFPIQAAAADLNGDGIWDIVYSTTSSAGVLLGTGQTGAGAFLPAVSYTLPISTSSASAFLAVGDFNGDGRVDVATANRFPSNVSIVLGNGDGSLQSNMQFPLHSATVSLVAGDFTDNGDDDLAAANFNGNDITVSLSEGNGFFQDPSSYSVTQPTQVVVGDFNGDGRLDIAALFNVDQLPGLLGQIQIFLGVGDGTFLPSITLTAIGGSGGGNLIAADLNGDGQTDLIFGRYVFLAKQTATGGLNFTPQTGAGSLPTLPGSAVAVGHFTGSKFLDVIVSSGGIEEILPGKGDGTFGSPISTLPVSGTTVVGDFIGNGVQDIAVAVTGAVDVFLGNTTRGIANGTFTEVVQTVDVSADQIGVGDFNQDGRDDLAVAYNSGSGEVVGIFLSKGDGTFSDPLQTSSIPSPVVSMTIGDFNGDGRLDIATVSSAFHITNGQLTVLLGRGDGTLFDPTTANEPTPQATPQVADINGDGVADVLVLDDNGDILFRPGVKGQTGNFGSPVLVNPGQPARDFTVIYDTVNGKTVAAGLAAVDLDGNTISLYTYANGQFTRTAGPSTGLLPTRIVSGDLTGDGLGDLVVINSGDGTLSLLRNTGHGFVALGQPLSAGSGPFDVTLADVNGDTKLDIVATDATSGDVLVFLNQGGGVFGAGMWFRAGDGPFDLSSAGGTLSVASRMATGSLVVGSFIKSTEIDIVAVNSGANSFSFLPGNGDGTFAGAQSFQAGSQPTAVVAGYFDGDNKLDLAVLNQAADTVSIYLGRGDGTFVLKSTLSAGNSPTGLSVADVDGDGKLDLLVGNSFGDVLILRGNGDGTFAAYQRLDQTVSLAVFNQNGQSNVILGNQGQDRVSMQSPLGVNTPQLSRSNDLLAPEVFQADVNRDGYEDLVVLNAGGNSVQIFFGGPAGINFNAPQTYFAGTNPSDVLVADVNGDGIPDLIITNTGSNDVSILFGAGKVNADGSVSNWSATLGPRLAAGSGPNSVALADVVHIDPVTGKTVLGPGGGLDLIVSDQQANDLRIIPGVGNGFFKDSAAIVVPGLAGQLLPQGNGAYLVDAATGTVHFIPDLTNPTKNFTITGLDAVSGIAGDFANDGTADALVVTETGIADLILGNADGVVIATDLNTALKDPSEMVLSAQQSGLFSFYVSYVNNQNVEAAQQFALDLRGVDLIAPGTVLSLSSVDDSTLALVAVLLSSNTAPANPESAVASSQEIIAAGNSNALARTLLDLDSHYTPNDGGTSPPSLGPLADGVQERLASLGSQFIAGMGQASKLLPRALGEVGSAVQDGLGSVDPDGGLAYLPTLVARSLRPLTDAGHLSAQAVMETARQAGQSAVNGIGQPGSPLRSSLPLAGEEFSWVEGDAGPAVLPLDFVLALSLLEGESLDLGRAMPEPAESVVRRDASEAFDLIPSALLAAGIAGGWLLGNEPAEPAKPQLRRS